MALPLAAVNRAAEAVSEKSRNNQKWIEAMAWGSRSVLRDVKHERSRDIEGADIEEEVPWLKQQVSEG